MDYKVEDVRSIARPKKTGDKLWKKRLLDSTIKKEDAKDHRKWTKLTARIA